MELKEKVKNLPSSPGVYLMKDSQNSIIYVGKSKNLKQRVQSYFYSSKAHSPKVEKLVKNLRDFDYILTDTEFEAFMLECKMIKEIKPRYNKLMKAPLSYTYIRIKYEGEYPTIEPATNREAADGSLYFGPYTRKSTVENAIEGLKQCLKINCASPSKKGSACLNYSLGSCIGMCLGGAAVEQYKNIMSRITALLNGTDRSILEELEQGMLKASESFDFEAAAKYRDCLTAVNSLLNQEKIIEFTEGNNNIVMFDQIDDVNIKLFLIKANKVLFSQRYNLMNTSMEQVLLSTEASISAYFTAAALEPSAKVAKDEIDEAQIIYSYLKSSNCRYTIIPEQWLASEAHLKTDEILTALRDLCLPDA